MEIEEILKTPTVNSLFKYIVINTYKFVIEKLVNGPNLCFNEKNLLSLAIRQNINYIETC